MPSSDHVERVVRHPPSSIIRYFPRMGSTEYPFPVAIKTGTSQGYRDAWTMALNLIRDDGRAGLRRLDADDRLHALGCFLRIAVAPAAVIADRLACRLRRGAHLLQFLDRAIAA